MSVVYTHQVRYHEVDQQGILFNARYLEIADVALSEFFRVLGWPYDELIRHGVDPAIARTEIEFRLPARFDDLIVVAVRPTRVGRTSFSLHFDLLHGDEQIAAIDTVYVNIDATSSTSRPLPTDVAEKLHLRVAGASNVDLIPRSHTTS